MTGEPIDERGRRRTAVWRKAALFTPAALLTAVLASISLRALAGGSAGAIFALVMLGGVTALLGYEAANTLRDLRATPITTQGPIERAWTASRLLFLGRQHHVLVRGRVFEVRVLHRDDLRVGDTVRVVHWPHTNVLISLHRLERGPAPAAGDGGRR